MSSTLTTIADVPESNETMMSGNEFVMSNKKEMMVGDGTDVSNNKTALPAHETMPSSKETVALLKEVTTLCAKLPTMESNEATSTATLLADMQRVIDDALGHGGEHEDSDAYLPQSNSTGGQPISSTGTVAKPWRPKHGYRRHYSTPPSIASPFSLLLRSVKQADVHLDTITNAGSMDGKSEAGKESKASDEQIMVERVYYRPPNDRTTAQDGSVHIHSTPTPSYYSTLNQSLVNVGNYVKEAKSAMLLDMEPWGADTLAYKCRIPLVPLIRAIVGTSQFGKACSTLDKMSREDRRAVLHTVHQLHKLNPAITVKPVCPFKLDAKIQDWPKTKDGINRANELFRAAHLLEDKAHVSKTNNDQYDEWCSAFSQRWQFLATDLVNAGADDMNEYLSLHMKFVELMMHGEKSDVSCCVTHRTLMA